MIRQATVADLPELAQMGFAFFQENTVPGQFSVERFVATWTTFLEHMRGVVYAAQDGDKLIGGISAFLAPDLYTNRTIAQECFWFVQPAYRHTRTGPALFISFENWAKKHAEEIRVGYMAGPHQQSMHKFFLGRGYTHHETHFTKEV